MTKRPVRIKRTHNQIANAIKEEARLRGIEPNDAYNQFFREVFLNGLMQKQQKKNKGWVLKGGTNVYCRIPGARQTKDLDLYRHIDPTSALKASELLVEAMDGHRAGPYTFQLERTMRSTMAGPVENEQVTVTVLYGASNEFAKFNIDVSGDLFVSGAVEEVTARASFGVITEFLPQSYCVPSYPVENQLADKVAAMFDRYGETPPGKASTRYHDFFDIALIASNLPANADALSRALEEQGKLRGMQLPSRMAEPEPDWGRRYEEKAIKLGWGSGELRGFEEALAVAGRLLDPVLANDPSIHDGVWDPAESAWKTEN